MADGGEAQAITAHTLGAVDEIAAADWNAVAAPDAGAVNPFVTHAFLAALERSQSACAATGWTPCHLAIEQEDALVAAAPLYVKSHSFGEYVFDHHWADAYERAGGRYYPKLLCAAPFTPVPGPRLLSQRPENRSLIAASLISLTERLSLSSAHVNFISDEDANALAATGFLIRHGVQYHWLNRGYRTYDDFLGALASRKRKALRRERKAAQDGVTIRRIDGPAIKKELWDAFWLFYQDTGDRKWGRPYLTRAFFDEIAETMADRIMMVVAEADGVPIAGALNFIGGDALFGRYWGRTEDRPFLHFELCYHQAIDYAIERGLSRVEAGAQGEHKIARGYEPVLTRSAHWIGDSGFRQAVARYLGAERREIDAEISALAAMTPFSSVAGRPH
ncbi:MAG TPA: GNAT family N-acetyltransferase [Parvularculaceae bacterium]|nr:GNAT family N-acetyltransferase [Parvularculaceae bacterium]